MVDTKKLPEEAVSSEKTLLTFKCPHCKGNELLEITTFQRSVVSIEGITDDGEVICGDGDLVGCDENWFECGDCGYVLKDEDDCPLSETHALLQWMKEHGA